jgi:sulfatase modifying factor 1
MTRTRSAAAVLLLASAALAQPVIDADWITIGDPGNPAAVVETIGGGQFAMGSVGSEYQIMRTQVRNSDWLEFCNAYAPFMDPSRRTGTDLGGHAIKWNHAAQRFAYARTNPQDWGAQTDFVYALRYCNWLHNGRVNEAWAFESGVYDVAAFQAWMNGVGERVSLVPAAGARYWIPTLDEWVKAAYYDPDKNGVGGWWSYPGMSDEPLRHGPPEPGYDAVGMWVIDNLGPNDPWILPGEWDLEQYPWAASAYGMLDVAGATREYTGTLAPEWNGSFGGIHLMGSEAHELLSDLLYERLAFPAGSSWLGQGFRLARPVPTPGTFSLLAVTILPALAHHRQRSRRSQ